MRGINLTGKTFFRLFVTGKYKYNKRNQILWECNCICGNISYVTTGSLVRGTTKSCSCYLSETSSERKRAKLIGQRFGKLLVIEEILERNKFGRILWKCICNCENYSVVSTLCLKQGYTKSCGCLAEGLFEKIHGMRNTKLYDRYASILSRCFNPNNKEYKNYGGRGITVCDR